MLEPATPIYLEATNSEAEAMKLKTAKSYNLDENFILKISINDSLIFFELDKINSFPKKDFKVFLSLSELGRINKFFNQFEDTQEVLVSFENLIESKNISVVEEEKKMRLKIINPVNRKEFFIDIPLKEKDVKSEMTSIIEYINLLHNRIEELEKKVNDLCLFKEEYLKRKEEKQKLKPKDKIKEKEKEKEKEKKKEVINVFKESDIIKNEDEINLILNWFDNKEIKTNLLFNSKKDGDLLSTLYKKVKDKSPLLIIIKTSKGFKFGGYCSLPIVGDNKWYVDNNSFIFSLDMKQKYDANNKSTNHILGNGDLLQFGNDIRIYDKATSQVDNFIGKSDYNSPKNYKMNGGNKNFQVSSFEVYEITLYSFTGISKFKFLLFIITNNYFISFL